MRWPLSQLSMSQLGLAIGVVIPPIVVLGYLIYTKIRDQELDDLEFEEVILADRISVEIKTSRESIRFLNNEKSYELKHIIDVTNVMIQVLRTDSDVEDCILLISGRTKNVHLAERMLKTSLLSTNTIVENNSKTQESPINPGTDPSKQVGKFSIAMLELSTGGVGDGYFEVYVSAIADEGHFWVQRIDSPASKTALENLQERMLNFYDDTEQVCSMGDSVAAGDSVVAGDSVAAGDFVAAVYPLDKKWYRARVDRILNDDKILVHYIDFGDDFEISRSFINPLRMEFTDLPMQAARCYLGNVEPIDGLTWSNEAIDTLESLMHCSEWKVLMAKITGSRRRTTIDDCVSYPELELIDTNGPQDLNLASEMVALGYATFSTAAAVSESPVENIPESEYIMTNLISDANFNDYDDIINDFSNFNNGGSLPQFIPG